MNTDPNDTFEGSTMEPEDSMHPLDYLQMFRRRIWLILSLAFLGLCIGIGWSLTQTPLYRSTAIMVFEPSVPKVMRTDVEQHFGGTYNEAQIQTHLLLLKSYPVLQEAANILNLSEQPDFKVSSPTESEKPWIRFPAWLEEIFNSVTAQIKQIKVALIQQLRGNAKKQKMSDKGRVDQEEWKSQFPNSRERKLVSGFKSMLDVDHDEGTKLVEISIASVDPIFAAHAANTLAEVYIARTLSLKTQATKKASQWFASHLHELRRKVEESEQVLHAYRLKHQLTDVNSQKSMASDKLAAFNSELLSAEMQRTSAQTQYEQIQKIYGELRDNSKQPIFARQKFSELTDLLNSRVIQKLGDQEIDLSSKMAELSEKYGPLHPEMIRAESQIQELRMRITDEVEKAYRSLKRQYQLATSREQAVRETLAKRTAEKLRLDQYSVQYSLIEREANSNRQLYDAFLKQMRETDISTEIQASTMYLAKPALPNMYPVKPLPKRNGLLGLLGGLGLAVGLTLLFEIFNRTLQSPGEVERHLAGNLFLGWVPRVPKGSMARIAKTLLMDPQSPQADSYRKIRTSVLLSFPTQGPLSLVVTSPCQQEGKSTLCSNLAIALSQLDRGQVVLIDGDLRRPQVDKIFKVSRESEKEKGLVQYLAGDVEIGEILHQTDVPNLAIIPAGGCPANHTELLHSNRFDDLVKWCADRNYHVIVDSPPVLPLPDSLIISRRVGGVILVMSAGETLKEAAKKSVLEIKSHGSNLLGVVLQKVEKGRIGYHPSYSYQTA